MPERKLHDIGSTQAPGARTGRKYQVNSTALAELRHNLRTPINHVLGYTEMLMEDAADLGHGEALEALRGIQGAARQILTRINEALAPARASLAQVDLQALCEDLQAPVNRIVGLCESLDAQTQGWEPPNWSRDLQKIMAGAAALFSLVREALGAPEGLAGGPRAPATAGESPRPSSGAARILVVDDNETNRQMLRRRLERHGYQVAEAEDGQQGLDALRAGGIGLVLLDILMPVLDGFQVLEQMKSDTQLREIPVIVISALDEMQSAVRAIELGAEDYLFKPFDPVLLRARMAAVLEKKHLRDQLVVHEKLASLGALTAGVAHELKNPLNFVTNFADLSLELVRELRGKLAAAGDRDPEMLDLTADLERNIIKIKEHGTRADGVISSMLMHSRTQSGDPRPTDLNALASEYIGLAYHGLRAQDPTFHARIEIDGDPVLPPVSVVPQDLSRVFLNVAGNAFYAVRRRAQSAGANYTPTVRLSTRDRGDRVEIRIRDNGTGIAPEHRERIFHPFFTTKPAGEGTGLGLSLSYDIVVHEHHGEMRVESLEGEFTEVILSLPKNGTER
jgi:signal transduction histidine kinase